MTEDPKKAPRLVDAMPRPLGVLFALAALIALAGIVIGLTHPPAKITLQDRRPAPADGFTHNVGSIAPLPLPSIVPTLPPACPAVAGTKILAGGDGVVRIRTALEGICTLSHGGVAATVTSAIGGLQGSVIRFGSFAQTGVDTTADAASRVIWLNSRFSLRKIPEIDLAPLILYAAYDLRGNRAPHDLLAGTAENEIAARLVEADTCRALVDVRKWLQGCNDAASLTSMDRARAIDLLASAGYDRRSGH